MMNTASRSTIKRLFIAAGGGISLLVFGIGGWAATMELGGAVLATGSVVVDEHVKTVQSPTGGVIAELLVRDGERVKAGDVLIRLDDTQVRSRLAIVSKRLDELAARRIRLEAERESAANVDFSAATATRADGPGIRAVIASEQRLFELRRDNLDGKRAQLKERITQLQNEIAGLADQEAAKTAETELILAELNGTRELWKKNLIPITRMTNLERESVRINGERALIVSKQAEAKAKVAETELEILQLNHDLRSEVAQSLSELHAEQAELVEREIGASDELKRIDIRAPSAGLVHQLAFHTVGGVVQAAVPIMEIVPDTERLAVEARIRPQDVDQTVAGQEVLLRFTAFNQATTPEIAGRIERISADITQDKNGAAFYEARIELSKEAVGKIGKLQLRPGMPADAFIKTAPRTALSYLVKPMSDQIQRTFRED